MSKSEYLPLETPELAERRRLRTEDALKLARRREAHLHLAVELALGRPESLLALDDARGMVRLWKRDRTCSAFYIEGWSKVRKGNAAQVARRIQDIEPQWLDAMLQNTPFSRSLAEGKKGWSVDKHPFLLTSPRGFARVS